MSDCHSLVEGVSCRAKLIGDIFSLLRVTLRLKK